MDFCYWNEELKKLIPLDDYKRVMNSPFNELEPDFLCFANIYGILKDIIPKDKIILDLGCCAGLQGYFFTEHKGYIGVDLVPYESKYPQPEHDRLWYLKNYEPLPEYYQTQNYFQLRANCPNSKYITSSIEDFINNLTEEEKEWYNTNCYVIMSYVPDRKGFELAEKTFDNFAWYYPANDNEYFYDGNKIRLNGTITDFSVFEDRSRVQSTGDKATYYSMLEEKEKEEIEYE